MQINFRRRRMTKRIFALIFALIFWCSGADAGNLWVYQGGSWHVQISPNVYQGGAYHPWQGGWVYEAGSWHQFYTACVPVTHTYTSGSGNESVPASVASLTINAVGRGNDGGGSASDFGGDNF